MLDWGGYVHFRQDIYSLWWVQNILLHHLFVRRLEVSKTKSPVHYRVKDRVRFVRNCLHPVATLKTSWREFFICNIQLFTLARFHIRNTCLPIHRHRGLVLLFFMQEVILRFGGFKLLFLDDCSFILVDYWYIFSEVSEIEATNRSYTFVHWIDDICRFWSLISFVIHISLSDKLYESF